MRKRCLGILLAFVALLSLTACGTGETAGRVTLTITGKKSDLEKSYMTSIFEQYEEATGNRLEIIAYEDEEFEECAAEDFANGKGPDVLMHFHNADLSRFDVARYFYYLNGESWVEELTEGARSYCQDREGNLLGLPFWENSVSGCYYNKTILDSLGLKPASTQAEFDMLCQALTEAGDTPICWPGDGCSWMVQFGLDPVFADDSRLLEELNENEIGYAEIPQVTDMVQWLADAAGSGWFGEDYLKVGWSDISPALGSGEAVMTFIWDTWFYTDFEPGQTYGREDFAVMPIFMNTAEEGTYEGGNLNMMMVNKDSENLEAALDFLEFCAKPEHYNEAFAGISTVNCFKNQTTNIQSQMVLDARSSIQERERVSVVASKVVGYNAEDMVRALEELFRGKTDVAGCVRLMDQYRLEETDRYGTDGF